MADENFLRNAEKILKSASREERRSRLDNELAVGELKEIERRISLLKSRSQSLESQKKSMEHELLKTEEELKKIEEEKKKTEEEKQMALEEEKKSENEIKKVKSEEISLKNEKERTHKIVTGEPIPQLLEAEQKIDEAFKEVGKKEKEARARKLSLKCVAEKASIKKEKIISHTLSLSQRKFEILGKIKFLGTKMKKAELDLDTALHRHEEMKSKAEAIEKKLKMAEAVKDKAEAEKKKLKSMIEKSERDQASSNL